MSRLVLTTNPLLEGLALEELRERAAAAGLDPAAVREVPLEVRGRLEVEVDAPLEALLPAARALRSVHHLLRPLGRLPLPADADALEAIAAFVGGLEVPELAREGASFRVTSERRGRHAFQSPDVERAAGAALVAVTGARVDLEGFDVEVRVDVIEATCLAAVQLTRRALSLRHELVYRPRVTLKPSLAYAALRLADVEARRPRRLLDPFCGAGTILLEAGDLLPDAELLGGDTDPRNVAGARENLAAAGLSARSRTDVGDALASAARHAAGSIDAVVTNPPLGARLGRQLDFRAFYARFLEQLRQVLAPGGRVAVFVRKDGAFQAALRRVGGLEQRHVRVVEASGLFPRLFVLEAR